MHFLLQAQLEEQHRLERELAFLREAAKEAAAVEAERRALEERVAELTAQVRGGGLAGVWFSCMGLSLPVGGGIG